MATQVALTSSIDPVHFYNELNKILGELGQRFISIQFSTTTEEETDDNGISLRTLITRYTALIIHQ